MNVTYLIEFQVKAEQRERFHALLGAVLAVIVLAFPQGLMGLPARLRQVVTR